MIDTTREIVAYRTSLCRTAAAWWASLLAEQVKPLLTRDAGHTSARSLLIDMHRLTRQDSGPTLTAADVERFEQCLLDILVARVESRPDAESAV